MQNFHSIDALVEYVPSFKNIFGIFAGDYIYFLYDCHIADRFSIRTQNKCWQNKLFGKLKSLKFIKKKMFTF